MTVETVSRMGYRGLTILGGVVVGAALSEAGLRLYFHDHEASRNYWGRYAFVADDVLPYRHAPSTTATAGREGSFGPHRITTNALGFRDHRLPSGTPTGPRIVVAGASFAFGLGIEHDEDLFSVQLEQRLRERPDCPSGIEVLNTAQTGFKLNEVCTLVEQEIDRFRPDMVLVVVHETDNTRVRDRKPDFVDGYRLDRRRWLAGTWVDSLRTRCYLWMRLPDVPSMLRETDVARIAKAVRRLHARHFPQADADSRGYTTAAALLHDLQNKLVARGIDLICLAVYPLDPVSLSFSETLRERGLSVIDIQPEPTWQLPLEGHWNVYGHHKAAEVVASRIPCTSLSDRRSTHSP